MNGSLDGSVLLWDVPTCTMTADYSCSVFVYMTKLLDPLLAVTPETGPTSIIDTRTGKTDISLSMDHNARTMDFDGTTAVVGTLRGVTYGWDICLSHFIFTLTCVFTSM